MKLSDLPDQATLVDEGQYTVVLDKNSEYTEQKEGEKGAYLSCDYVINGGEFKGRRIFDIISYSPKSLWKVKQVLMACGMDKDADVPFITEGIDNAPVVDSDGLTTMLLEWLTARVVKVDVKIKKATKEDIEKGWKDKNIITAYFPEADGPVDSEGWNE